MMHIQMTRCFNPVGQGTFCTETFEVGETKYHFVFDCGSSTRLNMGDGTSLYVNTQIGQNFKHGERIEAIFISHFDREHINGLEKLLKEYTVGKLFLPLVKGENVCFSSLKARIEFGNESGSFVRKLIGHPLDLLLDAEYHIDRIILVDEVSEGASGTEGNILDLDDLDNTAGRIASGSVLQCRFGLQLPVWKYVLANFRENGNIQNLRKAWQKMELPLSQEYTQASDALLWNEYQKEIIAVFMGKNFEDFNTNSLVVYSGRASDEVNVEMRPPEGGQSLGMSKSFFRVRSGCMYMGDFDSGRKVRWNQIKNMYREEWGEISVWLLPHHGSPKNFNHEMASHDAEIYIVCAESGSQYHRSDRSVIKRLRLTGKMVYWVNEEVSNKMVFLYELSMETD